MSSATSSHRFICSFCEQSFSVSDEHIGRHIHCAKCHRIVWVYPNKSESIECKLVSSWRYKRLKLLVTYETVGPLSDVEFLSAYDNGKLYDNTEVFSSVFTGGKWVELERINVELVRAQVAQRGAEAARLARIDARRADAHAKNRATLQRAVTSAISDGKVTLREREQLLDFARKAGIPEADVDSILATEADELLNSVIAEAIEDGLLEPHERDRICELATGLGIQLELTDHQQEQLYLCDLAYKLATGQFVPNAMPVPDVSLVAKEQPICQANFEWYEVTQAKRPVGVSLGNGHYLKPIATGKCLLTNRRVLLIANHSAKKFTLSSVARITRYADGVFFNRSSGKSVFLKSHGSNSSSDEWAMLAVHAVTGEPVLGTRPYESFVPQTTSTAVTFELSQPEWSRASSPRFTFRVVGDHIGNRHECIGQLTIGDPLRFERELTNPHDRNAVAVHDLRNQQLGYLKREVAQWFAPMIDRGCSYSVNTYRLTANGGLIVGVYELD